MMRRLRLSGTILVVVLALVAAACGGDDSGGDDTTTTAASADGNEQTTTTTTVAETTTTTSTTLAPQPVGGDSNSEWCQRLREGEEESPLDLDVFALSDPETAEQALTEFLDGVEEFASIAPPEIEEDVAVIVAAYQSFYDTAEAAGFDLLSLSDEEIAAFDDPALEQAGLNIDAYALDVCGVDFSAEPDPGPGGDDPVAIVLAALGLPAGLIPADVQECVLNTLLDENPEFVASIGPGYVPADTDVALLLETAEGCGFSLG